MIVTIDGPAGSGKSTIAKNLSEKLGWMFLDTGAMYRVVAWLVQRENLKLEDTARIAEIAQTAQIRFVRRDHSLDIYLNDENVTAFVRTEAVSEFASRISAIPEVRTALVQKQRDLAEFYGNIVTEGRDQGSVVFPNAELKVYLDADVAERARRRYEQLLEQGQPADLAKILEALKDRDHRDKTRSTSPLVVPDRAVVLDTTLMTPAQVLERLIHLVKEREQQ
jgi:cytidylate kinase